MAGSRGESWWQPPKDFDAHSTTDPEEPTEDLEPEEPPEPEASSELDEPDEPDDSSDPADPVDQDDQDDQDDDIEPSEADDDPDDEPDDDPEDPLEVELEDDRSAPPVGWTSPTGDVIPKEPGNKRFYVGVALILVATAIGVAFALGLGSDDDGGTTLEPTATTVPLDVRGATTIRPGGLSPLCEAEQTRVQQAEEQYQKGSVNGQYTDMTGLVSSGKIAAPSTLFVITNEVVGDPPMVSFAGTSAKEFEDFLVLPIPDGPCDTT